MKRTRQIIILSSAFVATIWFWLPWHLRTMQKIGEIIQTYENGDNRIEKD